MSEKPNVDIKTPEPHPEERPRDANHPDPHHEERRIWEFVSRTPCPSLWSLEGIEPRALVKRIWKSVMEDRLFGRAAELGFYFLFALFPTLFSASSLLGLAARSAYKFYGRLLDYLALVIPTSALGTVLSTFNETAAAATSGKVTFGLVAALWSASVGVSAIQDTLNDVYKIRNARSYLLARIEAIALTILLTMMLSLGLGAMLGGDYFSNMLGRQIHARALLLPAQVSVRVLSWAAATFIVAMSFALIYYWAPAFKARKWRLFTPGATFGMLGWLVASLGLRVYLHFFNNYSVTYGSLGAVIILLTWFYITGLMILLGAEINSEIEAAHAEIQLSNMPMKPPAGAPAVISDAGRVA